MEKIQLLFLEALRAAVRRETVTWQVLTKEEWVALFRMAQIHRVLPMVYQAVYDSTAAGSMAPGLQWQIRNQTRRDVMVQAQKTAQFLTLLPQLQSAGVHPLVVKGIVCRRLYPNPDQRLSSDEDLLICLAEFETACRELRRLGMVSGSENPQDYEVPFTQPGTAQLIEVHRSLFPPEQAVYGDLNRFFADIHSRAQEVDGVLTMPPTDHLLYLILHAYKHFLHSGFGIRQVCDMVFFANAYGSQIDWQYVLDCCRQVRADKFAAALFRIGRKYLHFSLEDACYPLQWQTIYVNEEPLLADILGSGIYGDADLSRKHSSNITLNAAGSGKKQTGNGVLESVFPPAKALEGRYPYLKRAPVLLPVAWTSRLLRYRRETASTRDNAPSEAIRIGTQRVELMREYGIVK